MRVKFGSPEIDREKTGRVRVGPIEPEHDIFFHVNFGSNFVSISGQISCQFRANFVSQVNFGSCRVNPFRVLVVFVSRVEVVFVSRVVFGLGEKKFDTALTRHEPDM